MVKKQTLPVLFVICVAFIYLLPFVVFGTNSYITIHDNLDSVIPWLKMFRDDNLFFKFDAPTRQFSGLSTLYYPRVNYSVEYLLYAVLDPFTAYVINHWLALLFGFVSMSLLLNRHFNISVNISMLVAVCYTIASGAWAVATGTLPLVVFVFLKLTGIRKFSWKTILLLFYPFFSTFYAVLWFVLGLWFVLTIALFLKERRPNINLVIGFIALLLGAIIVDIKLICLFLTVKEPLIRSLSKMQDFDSFQYWLKKFLVNGYNDVATAQNKIILPLAVFGSIYIVVSIALSIRNKRYRKEEYRHIRWISKAKRIMILQALVLIVVFLSALDYSGILNNFLRKFMPFLVASGFNWGRIFVLNRLLWYILLAFYIDFFVVEHLEPLGISKVNYNDKIRTCSFKPDDIIKMIKLVCFLLIIGQVKFEMQYHCGFNDVYPTIYKNFEKINRVFSILLPRPNDSFQPVSYREFYSVNLFSHIKEDINYSNEKVAALGYHAAVLAYNGFNTIDGYTTTFPLEYFYKFRRMVALDLEVNDRDRIQFDCGDCQLYLFNKDLDWAKPAGYKDYGPVELNIDMNILENEFGCIYMLSAAEILNAKELGLSYIKSYKNDESIYTIYLYSTR